MEKDRDEDAGAAGARAGGRGGEGVDGVVGSVRGAWRGVTAALGGLSYARGRAKGGARLRGVVSWRRASRNVPLGLLDKAGRRQPSKPATSLRTHGGCEDGRREQTRALSRIACRPYGR